MEAKEDRLLHPSVDPLPQLRPHQFFLVDQSDNQRGWEMALLVQTLQGERGVEYTLRAQPRITCAVRTKARRWPDALTH